MLTATMTRPSAPKERAAKAKGKEGQQEEPEETTTSLSSEERREKREPLRSERRRCD